MIVPTRYLTMTEEAKMLAGKIYDSTEPKLAEERIKAHTLCQLYNSTPETDGEKREGILKELLPQKDPSAYLAGPIQFDYGIYTKIGKGVFVNFNFVVLDSCPVIIEDNVFIGVNVSIVTPVHPLIYEERKPYKNSKGIMTDQEYAKPITIGEGTWLASNVVVTGGVRIGKRCVIAAGAVVTKDIPDDCLAGGVPCKVIRKIASDDSIRLKKDLW
jgi:maltose O-acetyltransferase